MGRTLGVVVAHPDDDAYGVAAVVALHLADPEFRFFLVHATDGEGGAIAEGSGATRETLGTIRRVEDANAWRVVGRSPYRHEWFGYPDGGLPDVPFDELVDRVATVLGEERPDVMATFGPDGITGHPDHIRIGEASTAAFLRFAGDGGPGFRRLVYGGIRQSVIDRWNQRRVKAGPTAWDPDTVYHLRGVPDERIDIDIDTTGVALLVRRAMQEHRTQWNDMNNPEATEEQRVKSVSRETQVIAWPGCSPTSSKTSDGRIGSQGTDQPGHRRILGDPPNTPDSHRSRFTSARQSPPDTSMIARSSKILPESRTASGLRHNASAVDSGRSMPLALIS